MSPAEFLELLAKSKAVKALVEIARSAADIDQYRDKLARAAMAGDVDDAFDDFKSAQDAADDFINNG